VRRVLLALAALAVLGAPAAQASVDPKDPVGSAVWVVQCVGDSLGGHACHG
jgi:hypothetical protein